MREQSDDMMEAFEARNKTIEAVNSDPKIIELFDILDNEIKKACETGKNVVLYRDRRIRKLSKMQKCVIENRYFSLGYGVDYIRFLNTTKIITGIEIHW